jgi:hypothetical protein
MAADPPPRCREECLETVDASRCSIGMAACSSTAGDDDDDRKICQQQWLQCLDEEGVDEAALDVCVTGCHAVRVDKECR